MWPISIFRGHLRFFQELDVFHSLSSKYVTWPGLKWDQHQAISGPFETSLWVPKPRQPKSPALRKHLQHSSRWPRLQAHLSKGSGVRKLKWKGVQAQMFEDRREAEAYPRFAEVSVSPRASARCCDSSCAGRCFPPWSWIHVVGWKLWLVRLVSLVQLDEKIETIQEKYNPDLSLNLMCKFSDFMSFGALNFLLGGPIC